MEFKNIGNLPNDPADATLEQLAFEYMAGLMDDPVKRSTFLNPQGVKEIVYSNGFQCVANIPARDVIALSDYLTDAIKNRDVNNWQQSCELIDLLLANFVDGYQEEYSAERLNNESLYDEHIDRVSIALELIIGCGELKKAIINSLKDIKKTALSREPEGCYELIRQGAQYSAELAELTNIGTRSILEPYTRAVVEFTDVIQDKITVLEVVTLINDAVIDAQVDRLPEEIKHREDVSMSFNKDAIFYSMGIAKIRKMIECGRLTREQAKDINKVADAIRQLNGERVEYFHAFSLADRIIKAMQANKEI